MEILKKKFEAVKSVYSHDWNMVRKIIPVFTEVLEIEGKRNYWEDLKPEHLKDIDTWSTQDSGVDIKFLPNMICKCTIWDCDNMYGERVNVRFKAKLQLPQDFIKELIDRINSKFVHFLEVKYAEYLQNEKRSWIKNFENQLLNEGKKVF